MWFFYVKKAYWYLVEKVFPDIFWKKMYRIYFYLSISNNKFMGFPGGTNGKNPSPLPHQCRKQETGSILFPRIRKIF